MRKRVRATSLRVRVAALLAALAAIGVVVGSSVGTASAQGRTLVGRFGFATRHAIASATSGIEPVDVVQRHAADLAAGRGLPIALTLAAASLAIAIAVAFDWQARTFLKLSIYLSVGYWVVGQGAGGPGTGTATDPNAGPLFVVLAAALWTLLPAASTQAVVALAAPVEALGASR